MWERVCARLRVRFLGASSSGDGVSADHLSAPYEVLYSPLAITLLPKVGFFQLITKLHSHRISVMMQTLRCDTLRRSRPIPSIFKFRSFGEAYKQKIGFPPPTKSNECTAQVRTLSETPLEILFIFFHSFCSPPEIDSWHHERGTLPCDMISMKEQGVGGSVSVVFRTSRDWPGPSAI